MSPCTCTDCEHAARVKELEGRARSAEWALWQIATDWFIPVIADKPDLGGGCCYCDAHTCQVLTDETYEHKRYCPVPFVRGQLGLEPHKCPPDEEFSEWQAKMNSKEQP
jgi:hypothetical protein